MNTENIAYPDDLFSEKARESTKGHFMRLDSQNPDTREFLIRFCTMALRRGAMLENGLGSPSAGDIEYFLSAAANNFILEESFIEKAVAALPVCSQMSPVLARSVYRGLCTLKSEGKNDSIIKNTFIKFMCWLRRDLARALAVSKEEFPPKILIKGGTSRHELMILSAAADAGCDVLVIDVPKKADPEGEFTELLPVRNGAGFPPDFTLSDIIKAAESEYHLMSAAGDVPVQLCTNAWISGEIFADILTPPSNRGNAPDTFYNCFARINGAENPSACLSELHAFYRKLIETRRTLVLDKEIPPPSNEEIAAVQRGNNYPSPAAMTADLAKNIVHCDPMLQGMIRRAFTQIMSGYFSDGNDLRKGISKAVYLICFLRRYGQALFGGYKKGDMSCLIVFGGCKSAALSMFVKMIARCPVDVLILRPDLQVPCELYDKLLYERNFTGSVKAAGFPVKEEAAGTPAYYAEKELDRVMYTDSGLYRSHRHTRAKTLVLKTMYKEISMLWGEELKYRHGFEVKDETVTVPVIMAKVSGVKNEDLPRYWNEIHGLIAAAPDNTVVIKNEKYMTDEGPCGYTVDFYKNGRLNRSAVKASEHYKYGFLKEETQDHILDRLEAFLNSDVIKDKKSNGLEYRIMYIALNMSSELLRLIQKFDFTRVNPKVVHISTDENVISRSDSILLAFLSRLGFDVVFYSPTGYRGAEKYYSEDFMVCHETGGYMFGLQIPDLSRKQKEPKKPLLQRIFSQKK